VHKALFLLSFVDGCVSELQTVRSGVAQDSDLILRLCFCINDCIRLHVSFAFTWLHDVV